VTTLKFGIQPLPQEVSWEEWRDAWLRMEELGFDSLWSYDHVHAPRGAPESACFEGWMGMAALGALTKRAEVGMLVSGVMYRNPALLVKMATTFDHIVGGRSILGIGAGWHVNEHEAYGWGFPPAGERVSRLEEALQLTRALLAAPAGQAVSYEGKYYRLAGAFNNPPPLAQPHPPILVAAGGPRMVRLAARYADIHDSWAPVEAVRQRYEVLRQECERIGRPFEAITRSVSMDFMYDPSPDRLSERIESIIQRHRRDPQQLRDRLLAGGTQDMIGRLRPLAEAGVQQIILHVPSPYDLEGVEAFAREVMPAFR
jgi:alkanesulfonate monooxygenase SsuD/methylene tetrahydromethanopterin reductase-like flavin-dependent oxidoreductase (luciferase family)